MEAVVPIPDSTVLPGRDLASLALLPVTVATAQDELDTWEAAYQVPVDGRIQRYEVTLSPGKAGWPTHHDQTVYLALLQLAVRNGCAETLVCQRPQVFDLLGWSNDGHYYERFRSAVARLTELTVHVRSALISRDGRPYAKQDVGAHLIDHYEIERGYGSTVKIAWGRLVREAFALEDLKRLDWSTMMALGNPLTMQLYRLLDRAVLAGETTWEVKWRTLAQMLGMNVENYTRPARLKQVLTRHFESLNEQGFLDRVDYKAGGTFTFHLPNYFRAEVRRVLASKGVFEAAARKLLAAYDEVAILRQLDCLQFGTRPSPTSPGGFLVKAVEDGYELQYDEDEPYTLTALLDALPAEERVQIHRAALRIAGKPDDLFATCDDPAGWPFDMRVVARFMICHALEPTRI